MLQEGIQLATTRPLLSKNYRRDGRVHTDKTRIQMSPQNTASNKNGSKQKWVPGVIGAGFEEDAVGLIQGETTEDFS